jgi:hypothetical protein
MVHKPGRPLEIKRKHNGIVLENDIEGVIQEFCFSMEVIHALWKLPISIRGKRICLEFQALQSFYLVMSKHIKSLAQCYHGFHGSPTLPAPILVGLSFISFSSLTKKLLSWKVVILDQYPFSCIMVYSEGY